MRSVATIWECGGIEDATSKCLTGGPNGYGCPYNLNIKKCRKERQRIGAEAQRLALISSKDLLNQKFSTLIREENHT